MKQYCTLQHDNDPKYTSKSTKDWLKSGESWNGQSPAVNPIDILWSQIHVHKQKPSNIPQLKELCIVSNWWLEVHFRWRF